jgi:starch synthase
VRILFVSAEVAPYAKVGGLADVAAGLPKELSRMGHEVRVVTPLYRMIEDDPRWSLSDVAEFDVRMNTNWSKRAIVKELVAEGVRYTFIGTDEWFPNSVNSETVYQPGALPHLFFSEAVIQASHRLQWQPAVVHCNDWHTGFLPVLMKEKYQDRVRTVLTIHNFAYQGEFGTEILRDLDLPDSLFTTEGVEAWGKVNFMKAGCVYADAVNTVSPNYAGEIQTRKFGEGLDGLTRELAGRGKLTGILNGIDTSVFDPACDPAIAQGYSADDLSGKSTCRRELLSELGLTSSQGVPLVGIVTRISSQKGLDLVIEAAKVLFDLPVQIVIQGLGDPTLVEALECLQLKQPDKFRFINRFDADLAQRVYSGSDAFLMPSRFEPCGLGQMIAMRYGTVPIVRKTGGLADTVDEGITGFVFDEENPMDLIAAVARCASAFRSETWRIIQQNCMRRDFGWHASALEYVKLYEAE